MNGKPLRLGSALCCPGRHGLCACFLADEWQCLGCCCVKIVLLRQLARTTAIFNPFSEAVANIEDQRRSSASMSGHGDRYGTCV